jgi:hypothetical protein
MADADHIRVAIALCRSSRWIGGAAIAVAAAVFISFFTARPLPGHAAVAFSLAILSGIAVIYRMVRIEFDRTIFEAASGASDAGAHFAAFDQSRAQLGLGDSQRESRPVAERVQGLVRLVRSMGYLFAVQIVFALAGIWIGRWLS